MSVVGSTATAQGVGVDARSLEASQPEPDRDTGIDAALFEERRKAAAEFGTGKVSAPPTIHPVRRTSELVRVGDLAERLGFDTAGLSSTSVLLRARVPNELVEDDARNVARAVTYGATRDDERRALVGALLYSGRFSKARRLASCGNRTENGRLYCGRHRLCPSCTAGKDAQDSYADAVKGWERFSWTAFQDRRAFVNPVAAHKSILDTFNRLVVRNRTLPVDDDWLHELRKQDSSFARSLRREFIDAGKRVPFRRLAPSGIAGVHITQGTEGFRGHFDVLMQARWFDGDVLGNVVRDCGGGDVAVPKRLRTEDGTGEVVRPVASGDLDGDLLDGDRRAFTESVDKAVGYISETVDIQDPAARVHYEAGASGSHAVRSWGM